MAANAGRIASDYSSGQLSVVDCPLFGLESPRPAGPQKPAASAPRTPAPGDDVELLRYFNDAVDGLNQIYGDATAGSSRTKPILRAEADRLVKRGAQLRDLK
jgi:hypothetical protein